MTPLIEKYINPKKIKIIATAKNFDTITFEEFIRFLDYILKDDEKHGFDEGDHEKITLDYVCNYITEFMKEREKGFSVDWSREYTYNKLYEENQNPPAFAYYLVRKTNPEQALKDLELYSELTSRDELFVKHFVHLIETDAPNVTPTVEEQAIEYSEICKQQIKNGKGELFADKYAGLIAGKEYTELSCYAEATEYEKSILAGNSRDYAKIYADQISGYIVNYFLTYEDSIDDELVQMERERLEKLYEHLK